jgi:methylated-DNA-[protein]-cysteine S-methyltransferase
MFSTAFKTGLGWMGASSDGESVCAIILPQRSKAQVTELITGRGSCDILAELESDIATYLSGERTDFRRYRTNPENMTPFRRRVWAAAREIPYGRTMTYGGLAGLIGSPEAARAVGGALNANPTPLLVPCHRVVSSSGVGGFSAGADLKEKLLQLEGVMR